MMFRVAGGNIIISGNTTDDVIAVGGQVHVLSEAVIGGDFVAAAGRVVVEGHVSGESKITAEEVVINGVIEGDVRIYAEKVIVKENAVVSGSLEYTSGREAKVNEEAQVLGGIVFSEKNYHEKAAAGAGILGGLLFIGGISLLGIFLIVKVVAIILTTFVLVLVFNKSSKSIVDATFESFWMKVLYGLIVLFVVPVVLLFLAVTLIGFPLAFLALLVYVFIISLAKIYAAVSLGSLLHKWIKKPKGYVMSWKTVSLGLVAVFLLVMIPFFGWLVLCILTVASVGSISSLVIRFCKSHR